MAMPRPSLSFDFARTPDMLDPRFTFTRNSPSSYYDRDGILRYRPANTPAFTYGNNGVANGLVFEKAFTNLLLWSADLTNAVWTQTNVTVTANTSVAPDSNTTADTVAVTAAGGSVSQAVTITAGSYPVLQVYVAPNASNFAVLSLSDGTNTVTCWYNLVNKVVTTHTAGAGGMVYLQSGITILPGGWCRVRLACSSTTATTVTASISAAAADNTAPVSGNSVIVWGAQLTQEASPYYGVGTVSYQPTTSATATRQGDAPGIATLDPSWFNVNMGTFVGTYVNALGNVAGCICGFGASGTDYMVLYTGPNISAINLTVVSAGTAQVALYATNSPSLSMPLREGDFPTHFAATWRANDFAVCVNGYTVTTATSGVLPAVAPARFKIGNPLTFASSTNDMVGCLRRLAYYPQRLTNAQLQQLTAG